MPAAGDDTLRLIGDRVQQRKTGTTAFRWIGPQRSDEALARRSADGDMGALARLYDRYADAAYGLALCILREPSLAEAAVENAFLALVRSSRQIHPGPASPRTILFTLVHRNAVDALRRNGRAAADIPSSEAPAVLALLPDDEREAFELVYYDGLRVDEVSSHLHKPVAAVNETLRSALHHVREVLGEAAHSAGQAPTRREPAFRGGLRRRGSSLLLGERSAVALGDGDDTGGSNESRD